MQLTGKDLTTYFYQYALWRSIDEYNQKQIEDDNKKNIIHTTLARGLGRQMGDVSNMNNGQFRNRVNQLFGKVAPGFNMDEGFVNKAYHAFTNMAEIGMPEMQSLRQNGYAKIDGIVPISPYDPKFSNLGVVLDNGSRLGGINGKNYGISAQNLNILNPNAQVDYLSNVHYDEQRDHFEARDTNTRLYGKDDVSGLSRLRQYMTTDEYNKVRDHVNSTVDMDNLNQDMLDTYRKMTDKAVYILRGLRSEGYTYSVQPDSRLGQIKAKVDNTNLDIRLTDTPNNAEYIGRVYDNGMSGTYNATRKDPKTGEYKVDVTPKQALDLVNVALGRDAYIQNSKGEDSQFKVGTPLVMHRVVSWKDMAYNSTYHADGNLTMVSGPYLIDGKPDMFNNRLMHNAVRMSFNTRARHNFSTYMPDGAAAENYLRDSVDSARQNFIDRVGVDDLIKAARDHADDSDYVPEFDNDPNVSSVQEAVWDEITTDPAEDSKANMLKPGVSRDELDAFLVRTNGEVDPDDLHKYMYDSNSDPEDIVRSYVKDSADYLIGQFDLKQSDLPGDAVKPATRFDPAMVVKFQTSEHGLYRNHDDMIKALKKAQIPAEQLKGNQDNLDNIASELVEFDKDSAVPMNSKTSPFMKSMYNAVSDSLKSNGVLFDPNDVLIDKNGIVQYKGRLFDHEKQLNKNGEKYPMKEISGEIGQIFEPGYAPDGSKQNDNILWTKFAGGNNYAIVPGYTAQILPQKDGEDKSVEERTVLTGYKQQMIKNIKYQMRQDLMLSKSETHAGKATSVNKTYRELYGNHRDVDFLTQYKEQGMPDHVLNAMIKSESQKVRYPNEVRDGSTVDAEYRMNNYGKDIADDNTADAYNLTGNRNMSVLTSESDGYFDPIASNATTTNQGIAKFLCESAKVDDDGHIVQGDTEGPGSRTSLMNIPEAEFMKYNPFDRENMTISNWLQAESVTKDVNVAQMTFGGWNQDDGIVISKKFADSYKLRDSEGNMRPLQVGDKISDMNGNKGVISLVVDPEMSKAEAEEKGISKEVNWFKTNPNMDVVMAPFSQVSRYNGGTTRQLMRNPEDLTDPETGKTIKAAMGKMPMIITDKAADVKTKIYDEEDLRNGKGRKVSAQLAWSLDSKDAKAIMHEAYGRNDSALSNLHEYLNTLGLDMNPYGGLSDKISDDTVKNRNMIELPELVHYKNGNLNLKQTLGDLSDKLSDQGGMMRLPFEIKLKSGQKTDTVPVLSSYLRSGQEMIDGTSTVHDYTHQYETLYEQGARYLDSQDKIKKLQALPSLDAKQKQQLQKAQAMISDTQKKAQEAYDNVASDVIKREFNGKHNIFKDKIMAHHMPHSATAVWSEDPRLSPDTFGISPQIADKLGLKDGDKALFWRDPALRDGAMRYMTVKVDDRLTGISSNPAVDKSMDGDYDGDTIGVVKLSTRAAQREAEEKFGFKNNLLDYGAGKDENGNYPLYMQHSLDIQVECHDRPELEDKWQKINKDVNDFEKQYKDGKINKAQVDIARSHAVQGINDYLQDVYSTCGNAHIRYDNMKDHLDSVKEACLDTGAKGNTQKFMDYAKWLGTSGVTADDKGNVIIPNDVKDLGDTGATRQMQEETMKATAIKSFGTGVAGAYSQRGIMALRNICPKAVTELTYPVTQSVLQIKHNPEQAVKTYSVMKGPLRKLWQGDSMSRDAKGDWSVNYDGVGKPLQATPDEWVKNFKTLYNEDLGVEPNVDYIKDVAKAMTRGGRVQSIENLDTESTMDKLAYGKGGFEDILEAAKMHENIFKGKYNATFAPDKLRDNVEQAKKTIEAQKQVKTALENGTAIQLGADSSEYDKKPKAFTKSDTIKHDNIAPKRHTPSSKVVMVHIDPVGAQQTTEPVQNKETSTPDMNMANDTENRSVLPESFNRKAEELENKKKQQDIDNGLEA